MTEPRSIDGVTVIGAGLMGAGIAEVLGRGGISVQLFDERDGAADRAAAAMALANVTSHPSLEDALRGSDLVIEAIYEDLEAKAPLLRALAELAPRVIVASNTSTFSPSELARHAADPTRLLVAHFFNPATVVPLVELVPGPQTSPDVVDLVQGVLTAVGKTVVRLNREIEGFVANRLQAAVLREAFHLVETGVVDADGLDQVVRASLGPRWALAGPLRVADLGGLGVFAALCSRLFPLLDDREHASWLERLIEDDWTGAGSRARIHAEPMADHQAYMKRLSELFAATP
ncbi:3-hydroxyacyl-CoA dehydrogenase family protein [Nocardioides sambongensis]|uniref:3-hydroxyacyl-CoA dehydrogenase family protein n=1 Tax=Nocardioides sambongensis TaxID=2589074 RepID=UPI00112BDEF2|nr:3-hydroxyacyl-CoA dehydrogenase family protein [Nocardioides sambongensis]